MDIPVCFRMDTAPGGEVTAIFLSRETHPTNKEEERACYAHVGQHGTCALAWAHESTREASPDEFTPLLRELQSIYGRDAHFRLQPLPVDNDRYIRTSLGEYHIAELRHVASEWHGGQVTALYAFSSTGSVVPGLATEARQCAERCKDAEEADKLAAITQLEPDGFARAGTPRNWKS